MDAEGFKQGPAQRKGSIPAGVTMTARRMTTMTAPHTNKCDLQHGCVLESPEQG